MCQTHVMLALIFPQVYSKIQVLGQRCRHSGNVRQKFLPKVYGHRRGQHGHCTCLRVSSITGTDATQCLLWQRMPRVNTHTCGCSEPGFATMYHNRCHAWVAPQICSSIASTGMQLLRVHRHGMQPWKCLGARCALLMQVCTLCICFHCIPHNAILTHLHGRC